MKKTLLILCILSMVLSLFGCSSSPQPNDSSLSKPESSNAFGNASSEDLSSTESTSSSSAQESSLEISSLDSSSQTSAQEASESSQTISGTPVAPGTLPVPGLYYLTGQEEEGEVYATADIAFMEENFDLKATLTIEEGGAFVIDVYGEETAGTYDESAFTVDGDPAPYTYEDFGQYQSITIAYEGGSMTFSTVTASWLVDMGFGVGESMLGGLFTPQEYPETKLLGVEWVKDYFEKDLLLFYLETTNTTTKSLSPDLSFMYHVTQDGADCTQTSSVSPDEGIQEVGYGYRVILPGVTLRHAIAFQCSKEGGPISFSVTAGLEDKAVLETEVDPANVAGAPAEAFAIQPFSDYGVEGLPASGTVMEMYEVEIKEAERLVDYKGDPVLRIWAAFTNHSEEAASFAMTQYSTAFQDGISLEYSWTDYSAPEIQLMYTEVEPGQSLDVCMDFGLISESPVVFTLSELSGFNTNFVLAKIFE